MKLPRLYNQGMVNSVAAPAPAGRYLSRDNVGLSLSGEEVIVTCLFGFLVLNGFLPLAGLFGTSRLLPDLYDAVFCLTVAFMHYRNRGLIRWDFWTIRFAFAFLCIVVVSPLWGNLPLAHATVPVLTGIATFLYANYIVDRLRPADATRMLVWALTPVLLASIALRVVLPAYAIDNGSNDPTNSGAWQGIFAQKNLLGAAVAVGFAAALGMKPRDKVDRLWRWLLFLSAAVCGWGSQSREAWVTIAIVLLFAVFLRQLRTLEPRSRPPVIVAAACLLGVTFLVLYLNLDAVLSLIGRDRTATGRTDIWAASLLVWEKRPWLGYGIYGLWNTPNSWDVVVRAGWNVTSSHNNYLECLLSYGIVGLAVYLTIPLSSLLFMLRALLNYDLRNLEVLIYVMITILLFSMAQPLVMYTPGIGFALLIYSVSCLERVERTGFMRLRD